MEANERVAVREQRLCYGNPQYYCIDCDAQICHLCANVFHDTHHVIPIYTGELFNSLDELTQRVMEEAGIEGIA